MIALPLLLLGTPTPDPSPAMAAVSRCDRAEVRAFIRAEPRRRTTFAAAVFAEQRAIAAKRAGLTPRTAAAVGATLDTRQRALDDAVRWSAAGVNCSTRCAPTTSPIARAEAAMPPVSEALQSTPALTAPDAGEVAAKTLLRDGVVELPGIADPTLLARVGDAIAPTGDFVALGAGAKWTNRDRFFAAVTIDGPIADPAVFANPALLAVAQRVLGAELVLDSFGVIVSLPGARQQHLHCDGQLFPGSTLDRVLPPFALTFALPLVRMDAVSGSTGFRRGSHRLFDAAEDIDFAPEVPVGSALLWDYRVQHCGLANVGTAPRPVLFAVYCRPWWQDAANFNEGQVDKLRLSDAAARALPPAERRLLARARPVN